MKTNGEVIYKKRRAYMGNISIILPDNISLNSSGSTYEDGMEIRDIDTNSRIYIQNESYEESIKEYFDFRRGESTEIFSDVIPVSRNELNGYYMMYANDYYEYCDYCFDLREYDDKFTMLNIAVEIRKGDVSIKTVMKSKKMKKLIKSLRLENQK